MKFVLLSLIKILGSPRNILRYLRHYFSFDLDLTNWFILLFQESEFLKYKVSISPIHEVNISALSIYRQNFTFDSQVLFLSATERCDLIMTVSSSVFHDLLISKKTLESNSFLSRNHNPLKVIIAFFLFYLPLNELCNSYNPLWVLDLLFCK